MSDIKVTKVETDLETKTISVNISDAPSSVNVEGWQVKQVRLFDTDKEIIGDFLIDWIIPFSRPIIEAELKKLNRIIINKAKLQWVSLTRNIRRSKRKSKSHFRK